MVNDNPRTLILQTLRDEPRGYVSGEYLRKSLGISRVAVHKHMEKLKALGYEIGSGPRGYLLNRSPDIPYPFEFPGRQNRIHYVEKTASTMELARQQARQGCSGFTVAVAGIQTNGRGRLNRNWNSGRGGLYFTVVTKPRLSPASGVKVGFLASVMLVKTFRRLYGLKAMVKWPNDVYVEGKKLAGMLLEMEAEADMASFINVGIGINVKNDPETPGATALNRWVEEKKLSGIDILRIFLDLFENEFTENGFKRCISEWKAHTFTLGKPVRVVTAREETKGLAKDVDEDGALIVETSDGSVKRILYGDCFPEQGTG